MSEHEQLHEAREQDADRLEQAGERLEQQIEDAKDPRERAAADEFIAPPEPDHDPDQSGPESDYPTKR